MGEPFQYKDITKQVLVQQVKTLETMDQAFPKDSLSPGVGIPEENIIEIRDLIKTLLEGATKMLITNKNQRKKQDEPIFALMVNSKGFRLIVTRNTKRLDYVFDLEKNNLILNKAKATELDADRFKQFFNRIISRMVDDQYEVTKDA
mgnify:FL=1